MNHDENVRLQAAARISQRSPMRIKIAYEVEVDLEKWAAEYGFSDLSLVPEDVQSLLYYSSVDWLEAMGFGGPAK